MEQLSALQAVMVIVGPIVLVVAIVWAMRHNRVSKAKDLRSEQATHAMYDEQERLDRANETR